MNDYWKPGGTTEGALTREALDASMKALLKQGSRPRHDCRFDGHVLQFNPFGFHFCVFCYTSEAEIERPDRRQP